MRRPKRGSGPGQSLGSGSGRHQNLWPSCGAASLLLLGSSLVVTLTCASDAPPIDSPKSATLQLNSQAANQLASQELNTTRQMSLTQAATATTISAATQQVNANSSAQPGDNQSLPLLELDIAEAIERGQFRHSTIVSVILTVAYTIVFVIGIVGNSFVVCIVCKSPRMRTVTNYFIVNLALADILVLLFCLPATLIGNLFIPYVLGLVVCKSVSYLQGVAVSASINTMVTVTMDRFLAVCFPMDWHMSRRQARRVIACIWLFSLTISLPWAIYFTLVPYKAQEDLPSIPVCAEDWPSERLGNIYFVCANLILLYLFPAVVIILCYLGIWYKIERRNIPGDRPKGLKIELIMQKSKLKVIKMMMVVVLMFLVSWMPVYLIFARIKLAEERSQLEDWLITNLMPLAQWLGASNSCINPILYTFFNRKYKRGFIDLLSCGFCCRSSNPAAWASSSSRPTNRQLHNQSSGQPLGMTNMGPTVHGNHQQSRQHGRQQQRHRLLLASHAGANNGTAGTSADARQAGKHNHNHKQVNGRAINIQLGDNGDVTSISCFTTTTSASTDKQRAIQTASVTSSTNLGTNSSTRTTPSLSSSPQRSCSFSNQRTRTLPVGNSRCLRGQKQRHRQPYQQQQLQHQHQQHEETLDETLGGLCGSLAKGRRRFSDGGTSIVAILDPVCELAAGGERRRHHRRHLSKRRQSSENQVDEEAADNDNERDGDDDDDDEDYDDDYDCDYGDAGAGKRCRRKLKLVKRSGGRTTSSGAADNLGAANSSRRQRHNGPESEGLANNGAIHISGNNSDRLDKESETGDEGSENSRVSDDDDGDDDEDVGTAASAKAEKRRAWQAARSPGRSLVSSSTNTTGKETGGSTDMTAVSFTNGTNTNDDFACNVSVGKPNSANNITISSAEVDFENSEVDEVEDDDDEGMLFGSAASSSDNDDGLLLGGNILDEVFVHKTAASGAEKGQGERQIKKRDLIVATTSFCGEANKNAKTTTTTTTTTATDRPKVFHGNEIGSVIKSSTSGNSNNNNSNNNNTTSDDQVFGDVCIEATRQPSGSSPAPSISPASSSIPKSSASSTSSAFSLSMAKSQLLGNNLQLMPIKSHTERERYGQVEVVSDEMTAAILSTI